MARRPSTSTVFGAMRGAALATERYNDQNERIGKIADMLVAPDGKLSVAVIDVGGCLGIGKHRVAIAVDPVQ